MKRTIRRWTTSLTAAALLTLPAAGFAQTAPPAAAPQTTPPAAAQPQPEPATPQTGSSAQEAARAHLTAARNTLSQMTQLPAASQLQGETRAQVAELITNFNELITTQANWKEAYEKVEANLAALLNTAPAGDPRPTGTAGAVGTSGTATLDPALRAKLTEFRSHLDKFEDAAAPSAPPATSTTSSTTTTTTTTQTEPSAAPPSTPPAAQPPPATQPPASPAKPDDPAGDEKEEIINHIDAIEAILSAQATAQAAAQSTAGAVGTSGTASGSTRTTITGNDVRLTPAQVEQLRNHLAELRRIVAK